MTFIVMFVVLLLLPMKFLAFLLPNQNPHIKKNVSNILLMVSHKWYCERISKGLVRSHASVCMCVCVCMMNRREKKKSNESSYSYNPERDSW